MKIIYYCQWLQGKFSFEQSGLREGKAVLVFAAAFTHYLFQKALRFTPRLGSTYPTILSRDSLWNPDWEVWRDGKAIWVHTGLPFPPMFSHFGSSQPQQRSFPPRSAPTRPHQDAVVQERSLLFCPNCSCTNWAGHFLDAEEGTKVRKFSKMSKTISFLVAYANYILH